MGERSMSKHKTKLQHATCKASSNTCWNQIEHIWIRGLLEDILGKPFFSDNGQNVTWECGFIPMSLVRRSWSRGIRLDRQTLPEVLTFASTELVSCPCSHGYLDSSSIRAILHTWRAVPWKHYKNPEASGRFPANLLFPFLPIRKSVSPWVECQCWEPPWASAWAAWTTPSLSLCGEPTTSPASLSNSFKPELFLLS